MAEDVLVVFDGLREPGLLCDPFTELFHKHCPVTEESGAKGSLLWSMIPAEFQMASRTHS